MPRSASVLIDIFASNILPVFLVAAVGFLLARFARVDVRPLSRVTLHGLAPVLIFQLLVTSRISGEIALKAGRAGLAWIASRSIPTTLALRIAQAASIPLVGRAPIKDAYVHNPVPPSVA